MVSTRREMLVVSIQGAALVLAIVIYNRLPIEAAIGDRLLVAAFSSVPFVLLAAQFGLPSSTVRPHDRHSTLLVAPIFLLIAGRTYLSIVHQAVPSAWEATYAGVVFALSACAAWRWWSSRRAVADHSGGTP